MPSFPNSIWNGKTSTRTSVYTERRPDARDWDSVTEELIATQQYLLQLKAIIDTLSDGGGGGAVSSVAGRTGAVSLSSSDISGLAVSATTDTTNASNISSGTLSNNRLASIPNTSLLNSSIIINDQSVSLGDTISVGTTTFGTENDSSGLNAFAEGEYNTASGEASHAEGVETTSSAEGSHSEGIHTYADAIGSHSEGYHTEAFSTYSHAEGRNTQAVASSSHTEGYFTFSYGDSSHAEGIGSIASGASSHAEGSFTTASGVSSHAGGGNANATHNYEWARSDGNNLQGKIGHLIITAQSIGSNFINLLISQLYPIVLPANINFSFLLLVSAVAADFSISATFLRYGQVINNNGTLTLSVIQTIGTDIGPDNWILSVAVDNDNSFLQITGSAGGNNTVNWHGRLEYVQIGA